MKIYLLLITILFSIFTNAQTFSDRIVDGDIFTGINYKKNLILNSTAEKSVSSGVTVSGAAITRTTTNSLEGDYSFQVTTSAIGQYVNFNSKVTQKALLNRDCEASFDYAYGSVPTSATPFAVSIVSGSTVVATDVMRGVSATVDLKYPRQTTYFKCPSVKSSLGLRLTSQTASSSVIYIDRVYLGERVAQYVEKQNGEKNYLSAVKTNNSTTSNPGNGDFELGTIRGFSNANVSLVSGTPTTLPISGTALVSNKYYFVVSPVANLGATSVWSHNGQTYTMYDNQATGVVVLTGTGAPLSTGTLTKVSGSGDATVTFTSVTNTVPSSTSSFAVSSTASIAGEYSGLYSFSGASTVGNAILSDPFYIDTADMAKVLKGKFSYKVTSGTASVSMTATASSTFSVWIYDVINTKWIQPVGVFNFPGFEGTAEFSFQPDSNANQFQLAIVNQNASSAGYNLVVDNFSLSRQTYVYGTPITDLVDKGTITIGATTTPPTKGTTSIDRVQMAKLGDRGYFIYNYRQTTAGTAGSGNFLFSLPSGISFDSSKVQFYTGAISNTAIYPDYAIGTANARYANALSAPTQSAVGRGFVVPYNATQFRVYILDETTTGTPSQTGVFIGAAGYNLSSVSMAYTFEFTAAIQGWSSSVQMSSDAGDGRVVAAGLTGGSATLPSGIATKITGITVDSTISKDSFGGWDNTLQRYNIVVPGFYKISTNGTYIGLNGSAGASSNVVYLYKNGVNTSWIGTLETIAAYTAGASIMLTGTTPPLWFNTGDYIEFYGFQNSGASRSLNGGKWGIERLSGNTTVAAGESINAVYQQSSGQSIPSDADTIINFDIKNFDSHGMVTTGSGWKAIVPISGKYDITGLVEFTGQTFTQGNVIYANVLRYNSSGVFIESRLVSEFSVAYTGSQAQLINLNAGMFNMNSGDYIQVTVFQNSGSAKTLRASSFTNFISIKRVGN